MAQKYRLTGSGLAPLAALSIGGTVSNNLTAAGSTQGTALAVTDDVNISTTTALSTGVILPATLAAGDTMTVANYGANALAVYPPTGGKINNGSANASVSVAANKSGVFVSIDGTNFIGVLSA